jgi:hypothetical protein
VERSSYTPAWHETFEAASDRAQQIDLILQGEAKTSLEFLQAPRPSDDPVPRQELAEGAAAGQLARLRRQRRSIGCLLLDRVCDAVVAWERTYKGDRDALCGTSVQLRRDIASDRLQTLLPLRVVVNTDSLNLKEYLSDIALQRWAGIGIDSAPALPKYVVQARCLSSGEQGVFGGVLEVGGTLTVSDRRFAMTCGHVTNGCAAFRGDIDLPFGPQPPGPHFPVVHEPDAALVDLQYCPCPRRALGFGKGWLPIVVIHSPEAAALSHFTAVHLPSDRPRRNAGYVASPTWLFQTGEFWNRAPAHEVRPSRSLIEALRRPFDRQFSYAGDSGSWIVREGFPNEWLGMLVGSVPEYRLSYVLDGGYLVDFFSIRLGVPPGGLTILSTRP